MSNRTASRRSLLSGAVALTLVLTACASPGNDAPDSTHTAGTSAATGDAVGALLIDNIAPAAAGFTRQPELASHTGATDLAQAVAVDGHADARAALTAAGFQHGYQRLWTDSDGNIIGVQVYRFATAAGARKNYARANRLAGSQAQRVSHYPVDGLSSSKVRATEIDVEGNVTEQVTGVAGRDVMQVVCTSRTAAGLRGRATAVASSQYKRISVTS